MSETFKETSDNQIFPTVAAADSLAMLALVTNKDLSRPAQLAALPRN